MALPQPMSQSGIPVVESSVTSRFCTQQPAPVLAKVCRLGEGMTSLGCTTSHSRVEEERHPGMPSEALPSSAPPPAERDLVGRVGGGWSQT
jgi:hypothetical protein